MNHYWRVIDMSNAVGVDPVAAMDKGHLSGYEWAKMVTLCQSCDWAEGCQKFLSQSDEAQPIPQECLNSQTFKRLKEVELN